MRALKSCLIGVGLVMFAIGVNANPEYEKFADSIAKEHQLDRKFVLDSLHLAKKEQAVLDAIKSPWEAKPWHQYYPIFLTDKRLNKGLAFWQEHEKALARAEHETGVPAQIIVAILGIESFYGTYRGKYSVLNALYTLGFHYPPRQSFFRKELGEFLKLSMEEGFEITKINGSYAGAMGWSQFISSSYRHYAVDFDQDGVRDLIDNPVDAIGSVANYFKRHGWKKDSPVAYEADVSGQAFKTFIRTGLRFKDTWAELSENNIKTRNPVDIADNASVKLLSFEQPGHKEYWIGLKNFYVITRYNHSPLYAMAVFQFSEKLKQHRNKS